MGGREVLNVSVGVNHQEEASTDNTTKFQGKFFSFKYDLFHINLKK